MLLAFKGISMTSKKLPAQQADIRQRLLHRLAQRTEASGHSDPLSPTDLGQIESVHTTPSKANHPIVMFRGKVKPVTADEKKRFYAAARDPKNKDRKGYPEIIAL